MDTPKQLAFKVVVTGSAGVGKSTLIRKLTTSEYLPLYHPTLGVEFHPKSLTIGGSKQVKLRLWDTAGMDSFRSIFSTFYRNSSAVILAYNIADGKSFQELEYWLRMAEENCGQGVVLVLVGLQKDLQEKYFYNKTAARFPRRKSRNFQTATIFASACKSLQSLTIMQISFLRSWLNFQPRSEPSHKSNTAQQKMLVLKPSPEIEPVRKQTR